MQVRSRRLLILKSCKFLLSSFFQNRSIKMCRIMVRVSAQDLQGGMLRSRIVELLSVHFLALSPFNELSLLRKFALFDQLFYNEFHFPCPEHMSAVPESVHFVSITVHCRVTVITPH